MGPGFEQTPLWIASLAPQASDPNVESRSKLSAAFHSFRERAALVAAEIPLDLRDYTAHDVTHLDALWEMADHIGGESVKFTPTEAFVLGGAFLIHDLGMGLAAWPDGLDQLRKEPGWGDILASAIRRCTGAPATAQELANPSEEATRIATEIALRERHASRAKDLALTSWESKGAGVAYHLIDDMELRQRYGQLIGEIAASHHWDIEQVSSRFSGSEPIGAPVDCPDAWTVDELKLACLMRVADAAHLDERRAPGFLRAIRSPNPYSDLHWAFQGFLQRPRRSDDRLVYSSARAFGVSDADAWWVCYESLEMVDRELRGVDSLLVERGRTRFAARGVKGIETPARMSEYIRTSDWTPIDARPRIENVPALVRKLGGEKLYGEKPRVALRELIQNARDASKAIETLLGEPARPIVIEIEQDSNDAFWLTVSDSGVGMSTRVLSQTLLDFGESFWGSDLMRRELPGLGSSQFDAVGRFGIGFYSVFMLGDHVTVTSRRFDESSADTKVLEFSNGLSSRPVLRPAGAREVKHIPGTSVRVSLRLSPAEPEGLLARTNGKPMTLAQAAAMMAPALDCDLHTKEPGGELVATVKADDWLTIPGADLLRRICANREYSSVFPYARASLEYVAERLETIVVEGKPVARVALAPAPPAISDEGAIIRASSCAVIGGLFAGNDLGGIAGIAVGSPTTADRLGFSLNFAPDAWAQWATRQASAWSAYFNEAVSNGDHVEEEMLVRLIIRLGGSPDEMIIGRTAAGPIRLSEMRDWASDRDEIVVANGYDLDFRVDESGTFPVWHNNCHRRITLDKSVIVVDSGGMYGSWDLYGDPRPDKTFKDLYHAKGVSDARSLYYAYQTDIEGPLLRLIADTWGSDLNTFLARCVTPRPEESIAIGFNDSGTVCNSPHVSFIARRSGAMPSPASLDVAT
ncbi:ATP-binding protein [Nocardiaceae bacterium NPDC056970]